MDNKQNQSTLSRRAMLRTLGAAACAASMPSSALGSPAPQEAPATHNWMLVGSQTAFLSHLPMFEKLNPAGTDYLTPHRFQVILQASFTSRGSDVSPLYFADRRDHKNVKMFTVSPSKDFVLAQVVSSPPLKSFQATVFRGHLERGGQPIRGLQNVRGEHSEDRAFPQVRSHSPGAAYAGISSFRSWIGVISRAFHCEAAGFRPDTLCRRKWPRANRERFGQRNPYLDSNQAELTGRPPQGRRTGSRGNLRWPETQPARIHGVLL